MEHQHLIPHLFRTEYRKIIAVLCKMFGLEHIAIAEDIVSETFLLAAETWGLKGLPKNPTAWLYTVSKNKALDYLRRDTLFQTKIAPALNHADEGHPETDIDLSNQNIIDSQLQMLFAICHPSISNEAQIGLALNILCGFGAEEIADAFLTSKETIYKRLTRAKEKLRSEKIKIELPPPGDIESRLETVLSTLYLLFSEGYYSASQNTVLRKDLCIEAMRLMVMLTDHPLTCTPSGYALLSLMCFHASRFEARTNQDGEIILYEDQDTSLWDKDLIAQGVNFLNRSAGGKQVTRYHLEAAIAYWHTLKEDTHEKWENILQLYNRLLQMEYSPIAALNRTYALSKANGKEEAIVEAEKLNLDANHFYHSLLANLYEDINPEKELDHLQRAWTLARNTNDKTLLAKKISSAIGRK